MYSTLLVTRSRAHITIIRPIISFMSINYAHHVMSTSSDRRSRSSRKAPFGLFQSFTYFIQFLPFLRRPILSLALARFVSSNRHRIVKLLLYSTNLGPRGRKRLCVFGLKDLRMLGQTMFWGRQREGGRGMCAGMDRKVGTRLCEYSLRNHETYAPHL